MNSNNNSHHNFSPEGKDNHGFIHGKGCSSATSDPMEHVFIQCKCCRRPNLAFKYLMDNANEEHEEVRCSYCPNVLNESICTSSKADVIASGLSPVASQLYKYINTNSGASRSEMVKISGRSESYISKLLSEDGGKLWLAGVRKIENSHGFHIPSVND